jgi:hypothetical protein
MSLAFVRQVLRHRFEDEHLPKSKAQAEVLRLGLNRLNHNCVIAVILLNERLDG